MPLQPEQDLGSSLAWLLGVKPPRRIPNTFRPGEFVEAGARWPRGDAASYADGRLTALMDTARRGGSENWIKLALACALLDKQPLADARAFTWLTELKQSRGWDGKEVGCRNDYWYFHRFADCVFVRCGSSRLAELAWESLDLFRYWASTGAPICGQRSAIPGRDARGLVDEVADFVAGRGGVPSPAPPTFDRLLLEEVLPELAELKRRPLANPAWAMATPVTFYVSPDSATVVLDAGVDANTPAILAGKAAAGMRFWLPAPPWSRIREQADGARATVTAGVVNYTSRLFPPGELALPTGASVQVMHLGSGTVAPPSRPETAPKPPQPTPAAAARRERWWEAW
jgi:hypothetical protein